ncbi:hypothetical protein [Streptomyces sp. NEAU-174]
MRPVTVANMGASPPSPSNPANPDTDEASGALAAKHVGQNSGH